MAVFQGLIGVAGLIVLAWAISENRRAFPWRTPGLGLAVPVPLALLLIMRAGPSTRRIGLRRRWASPVPAA